MAVVPYPPYFSLFPRLSTFADGGVLRGQRDGSLWPYSRFSRPGRNLVACPYQYVKQSGACLDDVLMETRLTDTRMSAIAASRWAVLKAETRGDEIAADVDPELLCFVRKCNCRLCQATHHVLPFVWNYKLSFYYMKLYGDGILKAFPLGPS
jgi:hypothetical protein